MHTLSRRDAIKVALAGAVAANWPAGAAGQSLSGTSEAKAQDESSTPAQPFHAWAATPPMGWNSWDSFGASVTEAEYLENARILAERFLPFGYGIATVDIQWYEPGAQSSHYRPFAPLCLDAHSRGFAPLAARVHRLGLRFGVHIMRGVPRQAVGERLAIAGTMTGVLSGKRWTGKLRLESFGVDLLEK